MELFVFCLLLLVANLVTALSPIPLGSGTKDIVLQVLRCISLLTHRDEQGTLRLPGPAAPIPARAELPPDAVLAGDLYVAYRCGWPISEGGQRIPEVLSFCPDGVQLGWRGVARKVRQLCTVALLALLLAAGAQACTPAQQTAARAGTRTAVKAVLDLASCMGQGGGSPLAKTIAAELAADPAARERYRSALAQGAGIQVGGAYLGAQDAVCLLSLVASVLPQNGWPHGDLGGLIVRRAELCDLDGGCSRAEDRAAAVLRDLWRIRRLVLPPSGHG